MDTSIQLKPVKPRARQVPQWLLEHPVWVVLCDQCDGWGLTLGDAYKTWKTWGGHVPATA